MRYISLALAWMLAPAAVGEQLVAPFRLPVLQGPPTSRPAPARPVPVARPAVSLGVTPNESGVCLSCRPGQSNPAAALAARQGSQILAATPPSPDAQATLEKLMVAIDKEARACRSLAPHEPPAFGKKAGTVSCEYSQPKGWCVQAVRGALAAIGITLPRGNANIQVTNLTNMPQQFERLNVSAEAAPPGSVIACGGSGSFRDGDIQIVQSLPNKPRQYCGDACLPYPSCGRGPFGAPQVFKIRGL